MKWQTKANVLDGTDEERAKGQARLKLYLREEALSGKRSLRTMKL